MYANNTDKENMEMLVRKAIQLLDLNGFVATSSDLKDWAWRSKLDVNFQDCVQAMKLAKEVN